MYIYIYMTIYKAQVNRTKYTAYNIMLEAVFLREVCVSLGKVYPFGHADAPIHFCRITSFPHGKRYAMCRSVARLKFKRRQLHRPLAKSWLLGPLVNRSSSL